MSYMIEAASKPRREFSNEAGGLVPYIVTSGIALVALVSAFWFVS
ncbi:hypothetical protein [Belnapia moabensis]|nr:hypothetical protein [Belnapia moabensis]